MFDRILSVGQECGQEGEGCTREQANSKQVRLYFSGISNTSVVTPKGRRTWWQQRPPQ